VDSVLAGERNRGRGHGRDRDEHGRRRDSFLRRTRDNRSYVSVEGRCASGASSLEITLSEDRVDETAFSQRGSTERIYRILLSDIATEERAIDFESEVIFEYSERY
jgi:hypothetical protein